MPKKRIGKKLSNKFAPNLALSVGDSGDNIKELQEFLHRNGYLSLPIAHPDSELSVSSVPEAILGTFDEATVQALKSYQQFHGLLSTGKLDEATANVMSLPRCGVPDEPNIQLSYVVHGNRWPKLDLTYRIQDFTNDLTQDEIRQATIQAFEYWSEVTSLSFTEVNNASDILIRFASGSHGDDFPFDGSGSVLAHAFYPPPNGGEIAGDAHFDDDEIWTVQIPVPAGSTDLVSVAAHEFGHSLGLAHSTDKAALMFPTYTGPHRFLADDDIKGVQQIYGAGAFEFAISPNADIFAIKRKNTDSNSTEVHVLSSANQYKSFILQTGSALHKTDNNFKFVVAPNRDLVAIKKRITGSSSTEVHVLSASSNYQDFVLQTGTALHETDGMFEFVLAPNRDLVAIKKRNTGSSSTEVHVLSASSNYQDFVLQTGTALHETDGMFEFVLAPNRDLVAIKKGNTGSNSTEVHVLSASSNYQDFVLQTGTALHETGSLFKFLLAPNRDIVAIKKGETGTHSTEVHILSASRNYQQFALQTGTMLHETY